MTRNAWWLRLALVLVLAVTLGACGGMQAKSTEQLLSASGFKMKMADSPQKQTHLQSLTQRKLVPHERKGKTYYTFANAKTGQLYVGNAQAYQNYQQLAAQEKIAEEQRMAAEMNMDAEMNWDMWGPWGYGPMW